jgi:hypothetical protein
VAVLPLVAGLTGAAALEPVQLAEGFRTAMFIAAGTSALGGLLAVLTIRNPSRPAPAAAAEEPTYHCALAGPPQCDVPAPVARPAA